MQIINNLFCYTFFEQHLSSAMGTPNIHILQSDFLTLIRAALMMIQGVWLCRQLANLPGPARPSLPLHPKMTAILTPFTATWAFILVQHILENKSIHITGKST
jgi:hypothetical protein